MQVETIQSALQSMQTKLAQVQKDIGEQLERYEYLVDDRTERSTLAQDSSHPDTPIMDENCSLEQVTELADAGDTDRVVPCEGAQVDEVTPDSCTGDCELATYFQKQEQGCHVAVMQAEAEALGYL